MMDLGPRLGDLTLGSCAQRPSRPKAGEGVEHVGSQRAGHSSRQGLEGGAS